MIGSNLKALRLHHHDTLEQLAEKIGVSRQSIAKWEKGLSSPDLEHCVAIADCYHVTLDTLVRRPAETLLHETDEETKALFGVVTVQENNTIELPETAREMFSLAPGDELLVVGDRRKGMAMVKINGTADFFGSAAEPRKETSSCNTNTST